jgi:uncharacterized protein
MNKVIIVFGLFLVVIAAVALYQFSNRQNSQIQSQGKVTIGDYSFDVEVAKDPKAQQIGLTKYTSMKDNQGMLFVFDKPDFHSFWMKNMKFPLDIIYIDGDTIVFIVENAQPADIEEENPTIYKPEAAADKVLEIQKGLVIKYNFKKGDKVKIEIPE